MLLITITPCYSFGRLDMVALEPKNGIVEHKSIGNLDGRYFYDKS